jgi:hypothetical protein
MFVANGTPGLRIWRVGTKRILGVADSEGDIGGGCVLPDTLAKLVRVGTWIYADFVLRPTTPERPGWMQMVCVASAKRIVVIRP